MFMRNPLIFLALLFFFLLVTALFSRTQALTFFSGDEVVVTGIITRVDRQSFYLDTGDARFIVDLSDLELADSRDFLDTGQKVAVRGVMEDRLFNIPIIEAGDILLVPEEMGELDASQLLLYDRYLNMSD